jgi:hypothetical protein
MPQGTMNGACVITDSSFQETDATNMFNSITIVQMYPSASQGNIWFPITGLYGSSLALQEAIEAWLSKHIYDHCGIIGANTAIQDAVVLANYIHHLADTKLETITTAFQGYHQERVGSARQAYETSDRFRQIFRKVGGHQTSCFSFLRPSFTWNC